MTKRIVSIGECMIEMSGGEDRSYRLGYAGDTLNTAWYLRALLGKDWSVDYATALGEDRYSNDIRAFLDASFETKAALLTDDALWQSIRPAMNDGGDDALFAELRDGYRAGIVTSYGPAEIEAAARFFALIAEAGGLDAVGGVETLAPGTFWEGYSK